MKRNVLLFFITFSTLYLVKAQTYRVQVTYNVSSTNCKSPFFNWTLETDGVTRDSYSVTGNNFGDIVQTRTYTINTFTNLSLRLQAACYPQASSNAIVCNVDETVTRTATQLILNPNLSISACNGSVRISFFKPNIGITLGNGNTGEVCIGDQLILNATPNGFPIEAYNWQYALDYQTAGSAANWQNFPSSFNSMLQVKPTMEELIGATHDQYINETIHIRVGRGNRPFSAVRPILYSPCAPLVTGLNYSPPNCTNDPISLTVSFDRPLDSNEIFARIAVVDVLDESLIFEQQNDVTMDIPPLGMTFTFNNVFGLEEGHTYFIEYQMKKDDVEVPGLIESAQTFTFNDATPVAFSPAWTHVNCFGDNTGSISITAAGGTGSYQYSIDNGAVWLPFSGATTHIHSNLPASTYNVKVKDANNCVAQQ